MFRSLAVLGLALLCACSGQHEAPGTVDPARVPAELIHQRQATQPTAANGKQILFGDLHVHSTFSMDAFALSLPIRGGEGAHPPADACDFARYCAALDFFSINDHAEGLTPQHWLETKESIRACNAAAGDPANPDLVAFLGWEWTQVGTRPDNHYGHKNVILLETAEERVPLRPISAIRPDFTDVGAGIPLIGRIAMPLLDFANRQRYFDFFHLLDEIASVPPCASDADTLALPADCREGVRTPRELFDRLDRWQTPSIVIPHGTTWGLSTPPRSAFDSQLGTQHDADRQTLIEIYSGHGSAEEYRSWRTHQLGETPICPRPTADYEPCCWRAGEIIRERCADPRSGECEARVVEARANFIAAGVGGYRTIVDTSVEDWLDCGQCRDCFLPAFDHRPAMSAQFALAATVGSEPDQRFRFGFISSSDTHSARAGKGYKELDRARMIDAGLGATFGNQFGANDDDPRDRSRAVRLNDLPIQQRRYGERGVSFIVGGGLVAVHAAGRDRESIWRALEEKEVYGTSGPRILLWFDATSENGQRVAMGSTTAASAGMRFRASAIGSFEQQPGCPAAVSNAVAHDRLERLCGNECHHPGTRRNRIDRIEVVRIRPRTGPGETVADLIDDPWRVHPCNDDGSGCVFEFTDEDLATTNREHAYYVRAVQEPTAAINGGGLQCEYDDSGRCASVRPCFSDERTAAGDDCLEPVGERAWSSPIFVTPAG